MRKVEAPLLILLTVLLLVAGAALPVIAAAIQDSATVNHSDYSEMQSLKLVFPEEGQQIPILAKLTLIRDGSFYTMSSEDTMMSEEEVKLAVEKGLLRYIQADLIPGNWADAAFTAQPHLVYAVSEVEIRCILWVVSIAWPDNTDMVSLFVDDETGLILYLHYENARELDLGAAQEFLDAFSNAYFQSTGISDILANPEAYGVESVGFDDTGLNRSGDKFYSYMMDHPDYGQIGMEFWIYRHGFYVHIREN